MDMQVSSYETLIFLSISNSPERKYDHEIILLYDFLIMVTISSSLRVNYELNFLNFLLKKVAVNGLFKFLNHLLNSAKRDVKMQNIY